VKVIHISASALAGAPGMLSDALEAFGHAERSIHFRAGDYDLSRNITSPESIPLASKDRDRQFFEAVYADSDVVHIHNFAPQFLLNWIAELGFGSRKFVYQIHSPLLERPLFDALAEYHGIPFHHKLSIGHFHPRQNPSYEVVPNCLYRARYSRPLTLQLREGRLVVFYSPSTAIKGRWTEKSNDAFQNAIQEIKINGRIQLETFEKVSPQTIASYRSMADVTIDEVVTGSYHLVSYEGLAAGTAVVNGADAFSLATFSMAFKSPTPPFLVTSPGKLPALLHELSIDRSRLAEIKRTSRDFFDTWMNPDRVASIFGEIYAR